MSEWHSLIKRADAVLSRVEKLLPAAPLATDWKAIAFRWRKRNGHGAIDAVRHVHKISLADLCGIDGQKKVVEQNTRQFVDGHPANNVLLTGARGTGKSSLIKALLNKYAPRGLRVIEVEKQDLIDLPEIVELIAQRPERFVLYESRARRLGRRGVGELPHLRDLEPPPPDARIHVGKPRSQARRR